MSGRTRRWRPRYEFWRRHNHQPLPIHHKQHPARSGSASRAHLRVSSLLRPRPAIFPQSKRREPYILRSSHGNVYSIGLADTDTRTLHVAVEGVGRQPHQRHERLVLAAPDDRSVSHDHVGQLCRRKGLCPLGWANRCHHCRRGAARLNPVQGGKEVRSCGG